MINYIVARRVIVITVIQMEQPVLRGTDHHVVRHSDLVHLAVFHKDGQLLGGLEGLQGQIPGLLDIKVITEGLDSSSGDLMLDSTFENEEALKGYSVHPAHVKVATTKVRPFVKIRSSFDY